MPDWAFFVVYRYVRNIKVYRNPSARQHSFAAVFQSENCFSGLRKSRQPCHPLHFFLMPVPLHFTYRRSEHVWFDILPISVVHLTTTFWLRASPLPNSREDKTWYAWAEIAVDNTTTKLMISFFILASFCIHMLMLNKSDKKRNKFFWCYANFPILRA